MCFSNEITNKLEACESCISKLKDTVLNCSDAFKNASSRNNISNNLTFLINTLKMNLNITDINDILSSPVANKTEFEATITNFTIVRSNDPDLISNLRFRRAITTSLNSSLQIIYSKVNFMIYSFWI